MINIGNQHTQRKISWQEFKADIHVRDFVPQFEERDDIYFIWSYSGPEVFTCEVFKGILPSETDDYSQAQSDIDKADFEDNFKDSLNKPISLDVRTDFEKKDKTLKLACGEAVFVDGVAVVELLCPGDFNPYVPSRYVAGGYAFTDVYAWGDRCSEINVVDKDNIIGYGADTVIQTYHDSDVPEENRGWYFWQTPGGQGENEVEPIGGYGEVPGGLYIQMKFKKTVASTATKVMVNVWWGVRD